LVELPVIVHNSHLLTTFLHQLPQKPVAELEFPPSLADLNKTAPELPLYPAYETSLDMSIDPFLEKSCDLLLDAVENHYTELNNFQYYQRQVAREQTKITAWQAKRKAENAGRVAAGQAPLPEDDWKALFKLPTEPSRLESMLLARQVEQYGRTVDNFTATISAKMFLSKDTLLPGEAN
jgi:translation initiation factor 3 subunit H